jgi:thiol:disulfide interchange protein
MKVRTGAVLAVVFGGLVAASFLAGRKGGELAPSPIPWEANLRQAAARAAGEHKLVLVEIATDWCKWCKKLEAETLRDSAVVEALTQAYVLVRLDAEKEGEAEARRFGVSSYPTIVVLDGQGQEVGRIEGYLGPQEFLAEIRELAQKRS